MMLKSPISSVKWYFFTRVLKKPFGYIYAWYHWCCWSLSQSFSTFVQGATVILLPNPYGTLSGDSITIAPILQAIYLHVYYLRTRSFAIKYIL